MNDFQWFKLFAKSATPTPHSQLGELIMAAMQVGTQQVQPINKLNARCTRTQIYWLSAAWVICCW